MTKKKWLFIAAVIGICVIVAVMLKSGDNAPAPDPSEIISQLDRVETSDPNVLADLCNGSRMISVNVHKDASGMIGMYSLNQEQVPDGGGWYYFDVQGNLIAGAADFSILNLTSFDQLTDEQKQERTWLTNIRAGLNAEFPNTEIYTCPPKQSDTHKVPIPRRPLIFTDFDPGVSWKDAFNNHYELTGINVDRTNAAQTELSLLFTITTQDVSCAVDFIYFADDQGTEQVLRPHDREAFTCDTSVGTHKDQKITFFIPPDRTEARLMFSNVSGNTEYLVQPEGEIVVALPTGGQPEVNFSKLFIPGMSRKEMEFYKNNTESNQSE